MSSKLVFLYVDSLICQNEIYLEKFQFKMVVVFSPIFVANTKMICRCNSIAPLTINMKNGNGKLLKQLDWAEILYETTKYDLIIQKHIQNLV